jgi:hypothetical protein
MKCNEDKHFAHFLERLPENKEVVERLGSLVTHRMLDFYKIFEKPCFSRMQVYFKCSIESLKMTLSVCNRIMVKKPADDRFRPPLHNSELLIVREICIYWNSDEEEQAVKFELQSEGVDKDTDSKLALKIRMKQVQQNRQAVAQLREYSATAKEEPKVVEDNEMPEFQDLGLEDRIRLLVDQPLFKVYVPIPLKRSRITESIGHGEQAQNERVVIMEATSPGAAGKLTGSQGATRQEQ